MATKLSPICSNFLLGDNFQEDKVFELMERRPLASAVLDDPVFAGKFAKRFPETKTILRLHPDNENHGRYRNAKAWIDANLSKVPEGVLIQDTNEPIPGPGDKDNPDDVRKYDEAVIRAVDFSADMARQFKSLGRGGVFLNPSVGTPEEYQVAALAPLIEEIRASDGLLLGIHEYLPNHAAYPDYWLVGRFARIIAEYGPLPIIITETGVVQRLQGGKLNGDVSWKGLHYSPGEYARTLIELWLKVYAPLGVYSINPFLHGGFKQHKDYDTSNQPEYNKFMESHAPHLDYNAKIPKKGQAVAAVFDLATPKWLVRDEAGNVTGDIQPCEKVILLPTIPAEFEGWRRAEIIRYRRGGKVLTEGREFLGYEPTVIEHNQAVKFINESGKVVDPNSFGKPKKKLPIVVKPPPVPDIKLSNTARLIAAHAIETGGLAFFKMLPAVIGAVPDVIAAREYLEGVYTELNTIE